MARSLIDKYNIPVPRYTSYPAVPNWSNDYKVAMQWMDHVDKNILTDPEISMYIHLPYCENLCTYCACNKRITKQHSVEGPYINAVIEEWKIYISHLKTKPTIKELHLGGGTPTFFSPTQLDRMLTEILSLANVSDKVNFSFEAHPNSTTIEHLDTLYQHGFRRLSIGVQDINPDILKAINRYQTSDQIIHLTNNARKVGYDSINFDIIYGLPFQGVNDIEETIDFIAELKPDRIAYYGYAHVPWKSKGQRAFTIDDLATGVAKQRLENTGRQILLKIGYLPIAMDHFALPSDTLAIAHSEGNLSRNFMGFTDNTTNCLIGLGCSSISECQEMYVQNEHAVESYLAHIALGRIPTIKGHEASPIEQRIKTHITNLICNDKTHFSHDKLDYQILHHAQPMMTQLLDDRIMTYKQNTIKLTKTGRPFVRNVCSMLDIHQQSNRTQPAYSMAI